MDLFLESLSDPAYLESTRFLYDLQFSGIKMGLKNITSFLEYLGNPQKKLKTVHFAGTNGKGSTLAIMEAVFKEAGYRTGAYTSPHLINFRERMRINGRLISVEYIDSFVKKHRHTITELKLTFFEATTGLAFSWFADQNPDILLVESGLGGRLDSTNVIHAPVTVITKIDFDHLPYLGDTLDKISREKAGIIHNRSQVFTSNTNPAAAEIIRQKCNMTESSYFNSSELCRTELKNMTPDGMYFSYSDKNRKLTDLFMPLIGEHQLENGALAIAALLNNKTFAVTEDQVRKGLKKVIWPGRMQKLHDSPLLMIDAGHNSNGFINSFNTLQKIKRGKVHTVCGIVNDKNTKDIAKTIEDNSNYIYPVKFSAHRFLPERKFASYFSDRNKIKEMGLSGYEQVKKLLAAIDKQDTIFLIGSHYLLGEFLGQWLKTKKDVASYFKTD